MEDTTFDVPRRRGRFPVSLCIAVDLSHTRTAEGINIFVSKLQKRQGSCSLQKGSNMASPMPSLAAALAGLTTCTTFFTMNTTLNYVALTSVFMPRLSKDNKNLDSYHQHPTITNAESSPDLLLRQWGFIYATGHLVGPFSALFSPAAFLYGAFQLPPQLAQLRTWFFLAALSGGMAFPFTVVFLLGINDELYRRVGLLRARVRGESVSGGGEEKVQRRLGVRNAATMTLIRKCLFLSKLRAVMPVPAMGIAVYLILRMGEVMRK